MKKVTKLFAALTVLVLLAASCAQRTCPTYANVDVDQNQEVETAV